MSEINRCRKIRKKNIKLTVNTLLLPANYREASDLVKWVQEEGIDGISFQAIDPIGGYHSSPVEGINMDSSLRGAGGEWYRQNLKSTNQNLRVTIDELIGLKKNGYRILNSIESLRRIEAYYNSPLSAKNKCRLGASSFNIDPYGYVRFCFNMNPLGNIKFTAARKLFNNKIARKTRKQIRHCHGKCHWIAK